MVAKVYFFCKIFCWCVGIFGVGPMYIPMEFISCKSCQSRTFGRPRILGVFRPPD